MSKSILNELAHKVSSLHSKPKEHDAPEAESPDAASPDTSASSSCPHCGAPIHIAKPPVHGGIAK